MKKYVQEATEDNIKNSIEKNMTGRNDKIYYFLKMLSTHESNWSIAINSPWGMGKTFFVKQCQFLLDLSQEATDNPNYQYLKTVASSAGEASENLFKNKKFYTVYYDAWKNDNEVDPLISLVASISSSDITNRFRNIGETLLKLASVSINFFSGIDISKVAQSLSNNEEDINSIFKKYKESQQIEAQFAEALDKLSENNEDSRLVIFIDELDRCKPDFAVKLLERIKHYFTHSNITFIFSTNMSELQHSVKKFYGEGMNGSRYLDRFFDIILTLPEPDLNRYYETRSFPMYSSNTWHHEYWQELSRYFNFTLREQDHFYSTIEAASTSAIEKDMKQTFGWHSDFFLDVFILPIVYGLQMNDKSKFEAFLAGKDLETMEQIFSSCPSVGSFLKEVLGVEIDITDIASKVYKACFIDDKLNGTYPGIMLRGKGGRMIDISSHHISNLKDKYSFLSKWTIYTEE